ncbi:response regulator transcription factor [Neobacillus dielmonensis]|uniref:response regulator transcription factor n=1 Tax=Neobacillus dielmonensis TaxID=1347369 RepID=UPI0005AB5096|nr:response regulator [Neobacillus dielmonensis]
MDESMTTLIVVEDEIAVRRSIIGKIRRENLPLTIQGEYQNAEDAYVQIKTEPPDIVLLDMRMPGMGGMKFLDILNSEFPDIQVIVLSGYSEFAYVQKAVKCGAKDYLLKPIVREELRSALWKAITSSKELSRKRVEEKKADSYIKSSLPLFKADMVNRLIQDVDLTESDYQKLLIPIGDYPKYQFFLFINGRVINYNHVKNKSLTSEIQDMLEESLGKPSFLSNLIDPSTKEQFQCIFGFREEVDEDRMLEFKATLNTAVQRLAETKKVKLQLFISRSYQNILDTRKEYLKSLYSSLFVEEESTLIFFDELEDKDSSYMYDSNELEDLIRYIKNYNRKNLVAAVNGLFERKDYDHDRLLFSQRLSIEILTFIVKTHDFKNVRLPEDIGYSFFETIRSFQSVEDIKYSLLSTLFDIAERISKKQNNQCTSLVLEAKRMIDERFQEEITLESISNKLNINKSYFSELFKAEIGLNFNKYLNKVRIDKAKELLVVHDMNATKISELVGYKDPVYFSIVFKKFTGLPPGEFKQKNQKSII